MPQPNTYTAYLQRMPARNAYTERLSRNHANIERQYSMFFPGFLVFLKRYPPNIYPKLSPRISTRLSQAFPPGCPPRFPKQFPWNSNKTYGYLCMGRNCRWAIGCWIRHAFSIRNLNMFDSGPFRDPRPHFLAHEDPGPTSGCKRVARKNMISWRDWPTRGF